MEFGFMRRSSGQKSSSVDASVNMLAEIIKENKFSDSIIRLVNDNISPSEFNTLVLHFSTATLPTKGTLKEIAAKLKESRDEYAKIESLKDEETVKEVDNRIKFLASNLDFFSNSANQESLKEVSLKLFAKMEGKFCPVAFKIAYKLMIMIYPCLAQFETTEFEEVEEANSLFNYIHNEDYFEADTFILTQAVQAAFKGNLKLLAKAVVVLESDFCYFLRLVMLRLHLNPSSTLLKDLEVSPFNEASTKEEANTALKAVMFSSD